MENATQGGQTAQAAGGAEQSQSGSGSQTTAASSSGVESVPSSVWAMLEGGAEKYGQAAQNSDAGNGQASSDDAASSTQEDAQASSQTSEEISDEQLTRAFLLAPVGSRIPAQQGQQAQQAQAAQPAQAAQQAQPGGKLASLQTALTKARESLSQLDKDDAVYIATSALIEGLESSVSELASEQKAIREYQQTAQAEAQQRQQAAFQEQVRVTFQKIEQAGIKGFGRNGVPTTQAELDSQQRVLQHAAAIRSQYPNMDADSLIMRVARFMTGAPAQTVKMAPTGQSRTAGRTHSTIKQPTEGFASDKDAMAFIRSNPVFRP